MFGSYKGSTPLHGTNQQKQIIMATMSKFTTLFEAKGIEANKTYIIKPSGKVHLNQFVPLSKLVRLYKDIEQVLYSLDMEQDEIFVGTYTKNKTR